MFFTEQGGLKCFSKTMFERLNSQITIMERIIPTMGDKNKNSEKGLQDKGVVRYLGRHVPIPGINHGAHSSG
jgi:hypothetical protein